MRLRGPRRTLVTGGARSGKSSWSEAQLARATKVTYVATARPYPEDTEWQARLAAHRARRPASWRTLETAELAAALRTEPGPLLIDDLGNWLTRALDEAGAWDDPAALGAVFEQVDDLVTAWRDRRDRVIAVTNEVGNGVVPTTPAGRLFRDELGRLNARLAGISDEVVMLVAGLPVRVR